MDCVRNMLISVPHRNATLADLFKGHSTEQKDKAESLLDFVGLYQKRHLISGELSFGQQKLLEFAMALMNERSEEHTSELQSLMRISYAVFCLKKKTNK